MTVLPGLVVRREIRARTVAKIIRRPAPRRGKVREITLRLRHRVTVIKYRRKILTMMHFRPSPVDRGIIHLTLGKVATHRTRAITIIRRHPERVVILPSKASLFRLMRRMNIMTKRNLNRCRRARSGHKAGGNGNQPSLKGY